MNFEASQLNPVRVRYPKIVYLYQSLLISVDWVFPQIPQRQFGSIIKSWLSRSMEPCIKKTNFAPKMMGCVLRTRNWVVEFVKKFKKFLLCHIKSWSSYKCLRNGVEIMCIGNTSAQKLISVRRKVHQYRESHYDLEQSDWTKEITAQIF